MALRIAETRQKDIFPGGDVDTERVNVYIKQLVIGAITSSLGLIEL